MRFFFYGSLLDPATRVRVLGPLARGLTLESAKLEGWRHCRRRRLPWPVIRPCPGGCVDGALTSATGPAARRLLQAYEGEFYRMRRVYARRRDGRRLGALAFVPV
jgi:hypothetical protein